MAVTLPHNLRLRQRRFSFFDALGYGSRPQRPSSFVTLMVSFAVIFHLGLLPILWQETPGIPSIVWTGLSASILLLTTLAARHSSISVHYTTTLTLTFFVAYPLFAWISYWAWGQSSGEREDLLMALIPVMFLGLVLYFVGAAARSHRIYRAFAITWFIIGAYALINARNFDMQGLSSSSAETGVKLNYQLMGDAFAICSTILAPRIRNAFWQWVFILVAIGVAFVIPSRSAAMFAVVALLSIPFLSSSMTMRVMVLIVAACFFVGYKTGTFATWFEGSRFESVFTPNEEDSSWQIRKEIMDKGLALITNRPFTGEWAFQLSDLKYSGYYMHNALDIWAQTGLIPFLLFLGMWGTLIAALITGLERWPRIAHETIPVLMFAALEWALSRNVSFVSLFFCLGFASAALAQARFGQAVRRHRANAAFRQSQLDTQFSHSQFSHSQFGYTQFGNTQFSNTQFGSAYGNLPHGQDAYGQDPNALPDAGYAADPFQDAQMMGAQGVDPQAAWGTDGNLAGYGDMTGGTPGAPDAWPQPDAGYPQAEGYPQVDAYTQAGALPQVDAYTPASAFPQADAYTPANAFPQDGILPQDAAYPQAGTPLQGNAHPQDSPYLQGDAYPQDGAYPQNTAYPQGGAFPQGSDFQPRSTLPEVTPPAPPEGSFPSKDSLAPRSAFPLDNAQAGAFAPQSAFPDGTAPLETRREASRNRKRTMPSRHASPSSMQKDGGARPDGTGGLFGTPGGAHVHHDGRSPISTGRKSKGGSRLH